MSIFKQMGRNWRKNTKGKAIGNNAKKAATGLLGGTLYWLVPTAIQGLFKVDMSGVKGMLLGASASTAIGMLSDKSAIITGGLTAAGVHATYAHLNPTITKVLNTPIFASDPDAIQRVTATSVEQETTRDLPEGYYIDENGYLAHSSVEMPDGNELPAAVNDYIEKISVGDYVEEIPVGDYVEQIGVSDYTESFNLGTNPNAGKNPII